MADIDWKHFAEQKRLFNQYECKDGEPGESLSDFYLKKREQPQSRQISQDELEVFFVSGGKEWLIKNHIINSLSTGSFHWIKWRTAETTITTILGGGELIFSQELNNAQLQSLAIYLRDYARQKGLQVQDNEIQAITLGTTLDGLFMYGIQFVTPSCQSPRQPQTLEVPEDLHTEVRAFKPAPFTLVPKVVPPKYEPQHPAVTTVTKRRVKPVEKLVVVEGEKARPSLVNSSTPSSGNRDYYLVTVNSKVIWIPADLILTLTNHTVSETDKVKQVGEKIRKATGGEIEISDEELKLIMRKPFSDAYFTRFSAS